MAALISGILATSTTAVITPNASAADKLSAEAFQPVASNTLHHFKAFQNKLAQQVKGLDGAVAPQETDFGPAWSLDGTAENLGDVQVRKLTGQSGGVGEGPSLDAQVRIAAVNLTTSLQKDLHAYASTP